MKEAEELIACWHKLEHFSLPVVQVSKNTLEIADRVPWKENEVLPDEGKTFEYTVYLGVFPTREVVDFVREFFKDSTEEVNRPVENVCVASLKVDVTGQYLAGSLGISTLTWALARLERGRMGDSNWAEEFRNLEEEVIEGCEILLAQEQSVETLYEILGQMTRAIGWSRMPEMKIYCKREEKIIPKNGKGTESSVDLLNSFFIQDLEMLANEAAKAKLPVAFRKYIEGCLNHRGERVDLNENSSLLKEEMHPINYPDGCWPSAYTLSLMQQFAVDTIYHRLSLESPGDILSVNGPPGTGKTTLLRDIIAANLVARAKEMLCFTDPTEAFTKVGQVESVSGYNSYLYRPAERLCRWGMVVASSNNGAVENISKELPLKKEVGSYREETGYFREVAETCMDKEYWGIVTAVLGNKENRNKLVTSLWFGNDGEARNLRQILKENTTTKEDWDKVTEDFRQVLTEVEQEKKRLECIRDQAGRVESLRMRYQDALENYEEVKIQCKETDYKAEIIEDQYTQLAKESDMFWQNVERVKMTKPGFFRRLFSHSVRRDYRRAYQLAVNAFVDIQKNFVEVQQERGKLKAEKQKLQVRLEKFRRKWQQLSKEWEQCDKLLTVAREELGGNYADEAYWSDINAPETQKNCPWYSARLKELQSRLFIEALKVHEVFLLYANSRSQLIQTSLSGFFSFLKGDYKKMPSPEEIKAMWDVFFLVIPVVSTTFASVQTLFHGMDKASLPWLFIDEAGQAVPQAAAGAIWRAERVVVVGDPLQIEPVVTIPFPVVDNICQYFSLGNEQVSAELSVQSMADRVNPIGMYLNQETGLVWVGIPLRVHRRCLNPMFGISNKIAYDGKMVLATGNPKQVNIQFENQFIHCPGVVMGRHWVAQQGELVQKILVKEIHAIGNLPDVFVISPFSEVSFQLKKMLYIPLLTVVRRYVPGFSTEDMNRWLKEHIGTVHTFQGKQAEGVILCLGLDEKSKGAARWASSKPNLLNVAVTRAKYRFVAVGDKDIWLNVPYFKELAK